MTGKSHRTGWHLEKSQGLFWVWWRSGGWGWGNQCFQVLSFRLCPSLCSGPQTHTPTPLPSSQCPPCPDLAASFRCAALCLQAHTHSHSCRTRCYACCTCGHCAGTRMSSTLMRPGGSWTSLLPAQSRSSELGSHNRRFQSVHHRAAAWDGNVHLWQ